MFCETCGRPIERVRLAELAIDEAARLKGWICDGCGGKDRERDRVAARAIFNGLVAGLDVESVEAALRGAQSGGG